MEEKQHKALSTVPAGEKVRLMRINAGGALSGRLAAMGLVRNVEITVIRNTHPGPFIVMARGTKMVLGRGMASKIVVTSPVHN